MTQFWIWLAPFFVFTTHLGATTPSWTTDHAGYCAEALAREPKVVEESELRYVAGHAFNLFETEDLDAQRLGLRTLVAYPPDPVAVRSSRKLRARAMALMQAEDREVRSLALLAQLRYLRNSRWLDVHTAAELDALSPERRQMARDDLQRAFGHFYQIKIKTLNRERGPETTTLRGSFQITNALSRGLFDEPFALASRFPFSLEDLTAYIGGLAKVADPERFEVVSESPSGVRGTFEVSLVNKVLDAEEPRHATEISFAFVSRAGLFAASVYDINTGRARHAFMEIRPGS